MALCRVYLVLFCHLCVCLSVCVHVSSDGGILSATCAALSFGVSDCTAVCVCLSVSMCPVMVGYSVLHLLPCRLVSLIVLLCVCLSVCVCVSSDGGLLSTTSAVSSGVPQCLVSATCIYRCLYDMALDLSDR